MQRNLRPSLLQGLRQTGVGLREIGIKVNGPPEFFDGAGYFIYLEQHRSQDVVAFGIFRSLDYSQTKLGGRSRQISAFPQYQSQRAGGPGHNSD
jgi:hypothetical protein